MSIAKRLMINTWYKYYNERIATHGNVNVQSHDQEESAFNSTIITNCGAHLTWGWGWCSCTYIWQNTKKFIQ